MLLLQNVLILALVYAIKMLAPLIAIPILARVIAESDYGVYMYAVSFSVLVSMLIEYGFNMSSTRDIASGVKDREVVVGTQSAKIILATLTVPLLLVSIWFFPVFRGGAIWACAGWLYGVLAAFSPVYYFQGKERLRLVGLVEVCSAGVFLAGILLLIKHQSDVIVLPFVLIFSRLVGVFFLTATMLRDIGLRVRDVEVKVGLLFIKRGFDFFVFQLAVSLYTSFNVVFLGFFCTPAQVGVYASAERLMRAGLGFIGQASSAIFPRINALRVANYGEMVRVRRLALIVLSFLGFIGILLTLILSPFISEYFFGGRVIGVDVLLNIMALAIPAVALSNVLGFQYLVVDRRERLFNCIVASCGFLSIPLAYFLIKFNMIIGMAYSWVVIEWLIAISIAVSVFFSKKLAIKY